MAADAHDEAAVVHDPEVGGNARIEKIEHILRQGIALQAYFGGDDGRRGGRLVHRAGGGGGKLNAVPSVKDHAVD